MSAKMSTKKKKSFTAKPGSYTFRKKVTPWCILFLPMAFTVWLKYYPIFSAFYISLFKYDPINPPGKIRGAEKLPGNVPDAVLLGVLEKYFYFSAPSAVYVLFYPFDPGASA